MTALVAAFPIYTRAELRPVFDPIWAVMREQLLAAGIDAPKSLTVVEDDLLAFWQCPDLLRNQTCGKPARPRLR